MLTAATCDRSINKSIVQSVTAQFSYSSVKYLGRKSSSAIALLSNCKKAIALRKLEMRSLFCQKNSDRFEEIGNAIAFLRAEGRSRFKFLVHLDIFYELGLTTPLN
jgi:hypothetical protein